MDFMVRNIFVCLIVLIVTFTFGCARIQEIPKAIWGSSTRALEKKLESDSVSKVYECELDQCFDEVIRITQDNGLEVFIQNRTKNHIVIMGFEGNIATTEAGIFFEPADYTKTKISITSLSPSVQEMTVDLFFPALMNVFPEIK